MFFLQMSGFPGSGKSTLSRLIAKSTRAIIVDHDIVKTALLESVESDFDPKRVGGISTTSNGLWSNFTYHRGMMLFLTVLVSTTK
jgi:predicted kinase